MSSRQPRHVLLFALGLWCVPLGWLCFSAGGFPATFPLCLQGSGLGPGTYSPWSSTKEQLRQAGRCIPCQVSSRDKLKPAGGRRRNGEVCNLDLELSVSCGITTTNV